MRDTWLSEEWEHGHSALTWCLAAWWIQPFWQAFSCPQWCLGVVHQSPESLQLTCASQRRTEGNALVHYQARSDKDQWYICPICVLILVLLYIPALLDLLRRSDLQSQCQLLLKWSCQATRSRQHTSFCAAANSCVSPEGQQVTAIVPSFFLDWLNGRRAAITSLISTLPGQYSTWVRHRGTRWYI